MNDNSGIPSPPPPPPIRHLWTGDRYAEANAARNPYNGTEFWVIPMIVAVVAYVARFIADTSCSP